MEIIFREVGWCFCWSLLLLLVEENNWKEEDRLWEEAGILECALNVVVLLLLLWELHGTPPFKRNGLP